MRRSLRIFLCCQQAIRSHAVPAYSFWAHYFRAGILEAGHTPIEAGECDWAEGILVPSARAADDWKERTWAKAVSFLRREHARQPIDFFLSYLFPHQILPSAIAEIRALGIPCVNFFCDNVREYRHLPEQFRSFDLNWVPEHKAVPLYRKARLPHLHAPMACWIPPALRQPPERESLPVTFVGTRDPQREQLFAEAIRRGLDLELRGLGWESSATVPPPPPPRARDPLELARRQFTFAQQHGWPALTRKHLHTLARLLPLSETDLNFSAQTRPAPRGDDYWRALRECTVCLGVNRYPSWRFPLDRPDTYSRLRDIEAPMAGACYLTEWTDGLDTLYDLGSEIETYRNAAELVEKARALAADAPRRQRMRVAGQRRALTDHSIARTIQRIADHLNCQK